MFKNHLQFARWNIFCGTVTKEGDQMFSENSFFKLFGFLWVFFFFSLCTLVEQAVKTILEEWSDFKKIESQRILNRKDFILDILSPEEIIIYRLHYISCLVISSNVCLAIVEKWISVVSCSLEKINYETLKKKWNKTSDESAASENQINKMFQLVIATVNSSTWNCITGCEMK